MPEGWIFQALWKHHAETRAKVCVPDTVLIKDGAPYRWLFTSRQGEVVRKRALDLVAVRDRFSKISLVHKNNEQRLVASLRERGSSAFDPAASVPRCLDSEKFTEFVGSRLAQSGNSVVALQAFVPSRGEAGTAFHNTYEINPDELHGRVVSTTHRVRYWKSGGRHNGVVAGGLEEKSSHATATLSTDAVMAPVRVRDQRLCSDFDATTLAIVNYVQRQHRVRVITMSCEYVVDADSRIWFMWGWNITAQKHKKKHTDDGHYAQPSAMENSSSSSSSSSTNHKKRSRPYAAGSQEAKQAEKMVGSAVERVETGLGGESVPRRLKSDGRSGGQGGGANFGIRRGGQTSPRGNPGPNTCHGDYCDFQVQDPAVLARGQQQPSDQKGGRGGRYGAARELFTENEMSKLASRLGGDAAVNDMLQGGGQRGQQGHAAVGPKASHALLFKSIALARKEKRGMAADEGTSGGGSFGSPLGGLGGSEL